MPFRVHIVAGDEGLRGAAADLLVRHGYRVRSYAAPEELLCEKASGRGCVLIGLDDPATGAALQQAIAAREDDLPVIALGCPGDVDTAVSSMKRGVIDFLELPLREEPLLAAVAAAEEMVRRGRDRASARRAATARIARLSPRERQILQGLAAGLSNKAIARLLGLSPRTVEMHRASMMGDLGIASLPEAVRLAVDAELPPLTPEGGAGAEAPAAEAPPVTVSLAAELQEPLAAITGFARGLRERLEDRSLSDEALREALAAVEASASHAFEIAGRIRREAQQER